MAKFYKTDPKHIRRVLGAVSGMYDHILKKKGEDPEALRAEFWERFGELKSEVIKAIPGKSLYFDAGDEDETVFSCGSCGDISYFRYKVIRKNDKFLIKEYINSNSTHMGIVMGEEDYKFSGGCTEDLDMCKFIFKYGSTVLDVAEVFGWEPVLEAVV